MSRSHLKWSSAARSHVGTVRQVNEDACLALPEMGLWLVADGMGGHEAGEVASQLVVDVLRQLPRPASWEDFLGMAQTSLREANRQIRDRSARQYNHRVIGSTAVALLTYGLQGACLWAGDSRLYRLRQGQLKLLTRDHSHVQELVDQGLINAQEALCHPLSNVITRAVGSTRELDIDIRRFPLQAGDTFLLCSDGLNKTMGDAEIAELLSGEDNQAIVEELIRRALIRGATDNVTVIVVHIDDNGRTDP